jgi:ketosteroid isomerase-like protein
VSDHERQPQPHLRPNVEVVRQVYEAFKQRDMPTVFALFAPDIEMVQSTEVPWGGTYKGHAGAGQFFTRLTEHVTSSVVLEQFIDAGEHVVAIGRNQGIANATGNRLDVPIAHLWALRNGKVSHVWFCIDNPTMQASLSRPKTD